MRDDVLATRVAKFEELARRNGLDFYPVDFELTPASRFHEMSGGNVVEQPAAHAHGVERASREHGVERVEPVRDAALALESHIDVGADLHRQPYSVRAADDAAAPVPDSSAFHKR